MGNFLPVTIALILLVTGKQIFREQQREANGPLISTYIFEISTYLLVWNMDVYPSSLRKLGRIFHCIIEFFIALFLFENILTDFWFPLEIALMSTLPNTVAGYLDDLLQSGQWPCGELCEGLKGKTIGYVISYLLSFFFLISVFHATRVVDLKELGRDPGVFFCDLINRIKRKMKRFRRNIGFRHRRRVQIKECYVGSKRKTAGKNSSNNRCHLGAEKYGEYGDFDYGCQPMDKGKNSLDDFENSFSDLENSVDDE